MGTRNLTVVVANKETKVAQYCQWDGYPSGQGLDIVKFFRDKIKDPASLTRFKLKIANHATILDEAQINKLWESAGADGSGLVSMDVSNKLKQLYPTLHRDLGAEVLEYIYDSTEDVPLSDSLDFIKDGLFCEWAYVVDLDKGKLEVYQGVYNDKKPVKVAKNRFTAMGGQVRLKKKFDLLNLPSNEEFCKVLGDKID